jgi:predicted MFS family arabinose efflux permease
MTAQRSEFALGWKALFAAGIGIAVGASPIPFNAIGHLVKPLNAEFGWERGQIMVAVTIFAFAVTFLSPFFGTLVDRLGVRKVAIGSLTLFGLSWMLLVFTPPNIIVFYLLWLAIGVLGGASIPISWTRAVNSWFVKNRGLALAVALSGTGIAGIAINSLMPVLIEQFGWRGGVIALGLTSLLVGVPVALLFFREPRDDERPGAVAGAAPQALTGAELPEALRDYRFWLMFFSFGMVALAFGGLFTNYVPLLIDKDFDAKLAGLITAAIGLSVMIGRLLAGFLIDRFWAPMVAFPMLALPAVACFILMSDHVTTAEAVFCAVLLGFAAGAETDLIAFLSARYYGLKNYGKIYGTLYMPFGLCSAISAPLYGFVFDAYGTYNPMLAVAAGLFVVGATLLLFIGRYPSQHAAPAH